MINEHDIADFIEINGVLINPKQIESIDKQSRTALFTSGFRMQFTTPDFNKLLNHIIPKPVVVKKATKK